MTDIVVRGLTSDEIKELRILKLQLEAPHWKSLIMRIVSEWKEMKK